MHIRVACLKVMLDVCGIMISKKMRVTFYMAEIQFIVILYKMVNTQLKHFTT